LDQSGVGAAERRRQHKTISFEQHERMLPTGKYSRERAELTGIETPFSEQGASLGIPSRATLESAVSTG
jgi:hypothetical protein